MGAAPADVGVSIVLSLQFMISESSSFHTGPCFSCYEVMGVVLAETKLAAFHEGFLQGAAKMSAHLARTIHWSPLSMRSFFARIRVDNGRAAIRRTGS
jgi:hypothetical protein